jgi:hypothetical protein
VEGGGRRVVTIEESRFGEMRRDPQPPRTAMR